MATQCGTCMEPITGMDVVVCRGYCGGSFHMNGCTSVTRAMQSYFTTHKKNLFWMCDRCAELFENSHFRTISCHADEKSPLSMLTSAITELRTEIKHLNSKPTVSFPPATNVDWPAIDQRRSAKRRRETESVVRASGNCRTGSKKTQDDVISVPIFNEEVDEKFWLYLSKIRPDVTVEAVSAMIKANLDLTSDPTVVKLVPRDKDISTLSFVSFKVGLDPSLKNKALDPETWPQGLLFREFEFFGAPKFRKLLPKKLATPLLQPQASSSPITPIMDLS